MSTSNSVYEIKDGVGIIPRDADVIQPGAFKDCKELKSVIIPEGIRGIGDEAFMGCKNLGDVVLPSTLRSIGRRAFSGSGLKTINIPEGITEIKPETFEGCWRLRNVPLPSTLESIGFDAFDGCRFDRIIIPASIKKIDDCDGAHIDEIMFLTKKPFSIQSGSDCFKSGVCSFIDWGLPNYKKIIVPSGCLPDYIKAVNELKYEYGGFEYDPLSRIQDMDGTTTEQYFAEKAEKNSKAREVRIAKEKKKDKREHIIFVIVLVVLFIIAWLM